MRQRFNSYLHGRRKSHSYPHLRDKIIALWRAKSNTVKKQYDGLLQELDLINPKTFTQDKDLSWMYMELHHIYGYKLLKYNSVSVFLHNYSSADLKKIREETKTGKNA
jgi:hypothetical protein